MAHRTPEHPEAANWTIEKRYVEAEKAVERDGWTQTRAAAYYGVDRSHLSRRLNKKKRRRQEQKDRARAETEAKAKPRVGLGPLGLQEQRRVPPIEEFDRIYFGNWICPDCGVHHETPEFHREIWRATRDPDIKRLLINMPPYHRAWVEEPVLTANRGWVRLGDIVPGDFVFAMDGSPTRVLGVSDTVTEDTYVVRLSDGSEVRCGGDHRWYVLPKNAAPRFVTTVELKPGYHRLPVQSALQLPDADLPMDPYTLGAWLGDGHTNAGRITCADEEVLDRIPYDRGPRYGITQAFYGLYSDLKRTGVLGDKHIPVDYLLASESQRLELLRGLMDTDGSAGSRSTGATFVSTVERLALDVKTLVESLGWRARLHKFTATLGGVDCGPAYVVTFLPDRHRSPFHLERKTSKLPASRERGKTRPIASVERIPDLPCRCIRVEHPSETFLIGRDLVVTGNSKSTNVTVKDTVYEIVQNPNSRTLLVSKSLPFTRTFLQSINEILTNHELYIGAERNLIDDWGPFKPEGQSSIWSKEQIYVAGRVTAEKDPTVQVLGVGQQIYGRRADTLKFDDIATLENQVNPDRVASMLEWIDKEALSRIGKSGKAIWVGTRVHHGDIYSFLRRRSSYVVLSYPCIIDDENELVLWPEHFPYTQALIHREEMAPADFQLIYQQVDIPGVGASFPPELVESCKRTDRVIGQFDPSWRMIGGVDPAGATKDSGYTAITVMGVDLNTGARHIVDQVSVKAMKAPQIKDLMIEWSSIYNIYEWRVEENGLQSQLFQYDLELIKALALKGTRVVPHKTGKNKWDPQFGVEGMAPLMHAGLFTIPWGNAQSAQKMQPFIEELIAFPMGRLQDRVMSTWFCDNGARDLLRRDHLPMFNDRLSRRWPNRVKKRRHVVDFESRTVRRVPLHEQRPGFLTAGQHGYRRLVVGGMTPERDVENARPAVREIQLVNVDKTIEVEDFDAA